MSKTLAVVQSNYIPWKGYFDLIAAADEFVLFDNVQYTRRDWRNRNQIKTAQGTVWLTIPVCVKGNYEQPINETRIADRSWAAKHWKTIRHAYARAPHFERYAAWLENLYGDAAALARLSEVNHLFLTSLCAALQIDTPIKWSTDYRLEAGRTERLIGLCEQADADHYLSGPTARGYLDVDAFAANGIRVTFFDYSGYPEYRQLHGPFTQAVSVIDLLLNEGPAARSFMKAGAAAIAD
jgi:hypothetical protein